jgi:hypothetical protein
MNAFPQEPAKTLQDFLGGMGREERREEAGALPLAARRQGEESP